MMDLPTTVSSVQYILRPGKNACLKMYAPVMSVYCLSLVLYEIYFDKPCIFYAVCNKHSFFIDNS